MGVQLDELMMQSSDVKNSLDLTGNQQILWRQTEAKMREIANARRSRRDQLQSDLKKGVNNPNAELRDLAKLVDAEADQSNRENKQLRELFLTVNDALDDNQRRKILLLLSDQLERLPDEGGDTKSCDQPRTRAGGRQRGGGPGNQGNPGNPQQ